MSLFSNTTLYANKNKTNIQRTLNSALCIQMHQLKTVKLHIQTQILSLQKKKKDKNFANASKISMYRELQVNE